MNELVDGTPAVSPARPRAPRVGERVGAYRLVKLLGAGAVGSVFEVEHDKLGRRAALKLLDPQLGLRASARARFFAEALATSRIHNPHIVEVTDVVETEDRQALVMELLDGQSLASALVASTGPLPPERFLPILAEVCEGLAAAHAAGFVHRDLKPDNIFLCARGDRTDFVKLLDFGLAMTFGPDSGDDLPRGLPPEPAGATRPSKPVVRVFAGSPAYVSPEQASGARVNQATDIYAVGVILYEIVTGRLPFHGGSLGEYVIQHATAPIPRLPPALRETALGRTLDVIVQRCMAKEPASRFGSAAELGATFAALARGELPLVSSVTVIRERRVRVPRLALVAAAVALAASLAAVALAPRAVGPSAPPPAPPSPARAVHVSIVFETSPPGAEARLARTGALLGVTPFRRAFARADATETVELARDGFAIVRIVVPMSQDGTVRATLVAAPPARKASARRGPLDVAKTMDPFRR